MSLFPEPNDYEFCGDKHKGHDYCDIVKEARIVKPTFQSKINSTIALIIPNNCCDECKEIKIILQNAHYTSAKKFFNTSVFLLNKTLLI